MSSKVKVALIGGTGYGGAEILRRLLFHPSVEVVRVTAVDNIGKKVGEVHLNLAGLTELRFEQMSATDAVKGVDVVFLAMPHKITAKVALEVLDSGVRIVDLSGDFRLRDPEAYKKFYGGDHPDPSVLTKGTFVYGLPELNRAAIRKAHFIASPGCFATTIALGLFPLAKARKLHGAVHTVAATGSSGSGANPQITGVTLDGVDPGTGGTASVVWGSTVTLGTQVSGNAGIIAWFSTAGSFPDGNQNGVWELSGARPADAFLYLVVRDGSRGSAWAVRHVVFN